MRAPLLVLAVMVPCLLAAPSIHAQTAECTPTSSDPTYHIGPVAVFHTAHTTFVFLETNGVPGIQRNDTLNAKRAPDETCGAPYDQPVTGVYH